MPPTLPPLATKNPIRRVGNGGLRDSRKLFLERHGTPMTHHDSAVISTVVTYLLKRIEESEREPIITKRASICTETMIFLTKNPLIMAVTPQFLEAVRTLVDEFKRDAYKITVYWRRRALEKAIRDLKYVTRV